MQGGGSVDVCALIFHDEILFQTEEELLGREAVEVAYHAVIVDNTQVGGGKCHGKEVVVFLVAGMRWILLRLLQPHARSGSRPVMSVGYI